ncbi:phasin [Methylobacterium aquaticum]|jgi:phasin|uniref:Phasin n=1 Tax=Methylobacterium aquaticum TaxID=270351 RepID=A0A0J6SKW4_9HYPH|nr:phasin [Methylobacterium aquaticum]KMO34008.1 phasin [Methylobacterium aquaticum]
MTTTQKSFEIPTEMRDFAEKGVQNARSAFGTFLGTARKLAETVQSSTQTSQTGMGTAVARGFDYTEQHASATFDLAEKLVRTRDVKEALALQSEYMRNQMSTLQSQAKEFAALSETIKADLNKAQAKA